jgi:osmotically-inducible protein OsmY
MRHTPVTSDTLIATCTGGVVHLWGLVGSPEERTALVALAEGVRVVVGVSDEMIPSYG